MIHFECRTCHLTATVVGNEVGKLAWLDHMNIHAVPDGYDMWTWTAVHLPYEDFDPTAKR